MKIELIEYTKNADKLLIFTKKTRRMDENSSFEDCFNLTDEDIKKELEYTLQTISGPWEFVDYVFFIQGVTRSFTHQLVRTRVGVSFAQESLRIADKSNFNYRKSSDHPEFSAVMDRINTGYNVMVLEGVPIQNARGVLPSDILTNIVMKINLRALNNMMNVRLCVRTSAEYQEVAKRIRDLVISVHPWAESVLLPFCLEWGVCKFQAYNDCPIKQQYPWLQKDNDKISNAKKVWEDITGVSSQPK